MAAQDLNLDGRSDLIWRGTDGSVRLWTMNGATIAGDFGIRQIASDWKVIGVGDFWNDGKSELVLETGAGTVHMWTISLPPNGAYVDDREIAYRVPAEWIVQSVADYDGDGKVDLLWRSSVTGQLRLWNLNGNNLGAPALQYNAPVQTGFVSADWKVAGGGDFDGDGKADILWRNDNGANRIWLMNGTSLKLDTPIGNGGGSISTTWKVAGVGDVNGDGRADIVWQSSQGEVRMWLMNGAAITADIHLANIVGNWTVQAAADYDGDGYADLMWRETSGEVRLWTMSPSGGIISDQRVALVGAEYHIVNTAAG